jgi:uncharacterized protein with GYD domain
VGVVPGVVVVSGDGLADGKEYANAPARARANEEAAKAMGGRIVATYWCLGQYDFVTIVEAPTDESMVIGNLVAASRGTIRTTTMRVFTIDEMEGIVKQAQAAG